MSVSKILPRLFLALALLAGQQAIVVHELSHGLSELARKPDAPEPAGHVCEQCLAFASLAHAVSSLALPIAPPETSHAQSETWHWAPLTPRDRLAYRSRAPPQLA